MSRSRFRREFGSRGLSLSLASALAGLVSLSGGTALAQDRSERDGERNVRRNQVKITAQAKLAIRRGLDYLAAPGRQQKSGAYIDGIGRKVNDRYVHDKGEHVGVTGLVGMAFLSNGSTPGRGPYGKNVQGCVDFVLSKVTQNGMIKNGGSRMYSHAFATLFLGEVYGMAPSDKVRRGLRRAINLIVAAQNEQGGWRYMPGAEDSDISITVCQVQALRAARNVGIRVPANTIDHAIEYIRRSYVDPSQGNFRDRNGFWYQTYEHSRYRPSRTSFALTAAGVTALYGAGIYNGRELKGGLEYLFNRRNRPSRVKLKNSFDYFYGHYYAIQAFFQAGDGGARPYWSRWYPYIRDELVGGQWPDGRWQDYVGPIYATSMATIILQIPYRYLPIFER